MNATELVEWFCPHCLEGNEDCLPPETVMPECANCGHAFIWAELLPEESTGSPVT